MPNTSRRILLVVVFWLGCLAKPLLGANIPVVFIPGILGSELVDQNGTKVWGPVISSLRNFHRLELPQDPAKNQIRASGLVNEVQFLGPFKIDQYSGLLSTFRDLGYQEGRDLFLFPYDWRQSNFDTAAELRNFVRNKPALRGHYRIVAHSMGGVVARIFIDRYPEGKRVDRLITLGTPHLGSQAALRPLLEGFGSVQNTLAGGSEIVRRVAFSFPSLYEMLPFYAGCCLREQPGAPQKIDLLLQETWDRFTWLPAFENSNSARERRREGLRRARELRDIVRKGLPDGVTLFPIAGAVLSTQSEVLISENRETIRWGLEKSGDGTVVEGSAAAGRLADARVAIRRHSTIFEDQHVKIQLARLLLDNQEIEEFGSVSATARVTTKSGDRVNLSRVDISFEPSLVRVSQESLVSLSVFDSNGLRVAKLAPSVSLSLEGGGLQQQISLTADADGTLRGRVKPDVSGTYRISVTLPGVEGLFEEFLIVISD